MQTQNNLYLKCQQCTYLCNRDVLWKIKPESETYEINKNYFDGNNGNMIISTDNPLYCLYCMDNEYRTYLIHYYGNYEYLRYVKSGYEWIQNNIELCNSKENRQIIPVPEFNFNNFPKLTKDSHKNKEKL